MTSARVFDVVDRLDILDLYARQSHLIDGGDADGWARTYTPDGVFVSPTYRLTARGHDELRSFADSSNRAALERGDQLRHLVNQIMIRPDEADAEASTAAVVQAYLVIIATSSAGTRIDRSVRMFDHLVKVDSEWLIRSREVFRDQMDPVPTP